MDRPLMLDRDCDEMNVTLGNPHHSPLLSQNNNKDMQGVSKAYWIKIERGRENRLSEFHNGDVNKCNSFTRNQWPTEKLIGFKIQAHERAKEKEKLKKNQMTIKDTL